VPICKYLALTGSTDVLLFPLDEIPQSHKCQSLTLTPSVLQEPSCCSSDDVQSDNFLSPELPLLKTGADERLCGAEQVFPKNIFSFASLAVEGL